MTRDESRDPRMMDALGRVVTQVTPPSGLRARVLATASPGPVAASRATRAVTPWLLAAAATLMAVTASLGWWSARGEVTRLQAMVATLESGRNALLNARADLEREQSERDRAAAILSANDVQQVSLQGVAPADAARARVYVSASRGMVMAAEGLPELPAGRTYQLWAIVGSTPVSAGTFTRDSSGLARLVSASRVESPAALAVTVEPAGGVPAPTGPKYLLGTPVN